MKNLYIVANWKSNKTQEESAQFIKQFNELYVPSENKQVIICPSFISISSMFDLIKASNLKLFIGAQNISPFDPGAFTGEVNSGQIKDICAYCIVGHSERRKIFGEDNLIINDKIKHLIEIGITPIVCVSSMEQAASLTDQINEKGIVAYEPLSAIGTNNSIDPDEANLFASEIKKKLKVKVLYGGSVNIENVSSFTSKEFIDGVLVGAESLNPQGLSQIIKNA